MTRLAAFRDDGPLAGALHAEPAGRLRWLLPPAVRVLEYGGLIALTAAAAPSAMPACFALLGVLAFHHYDIVYRLRAQGQAPPDWLRLAAGGWDGRLLVAAVLALAGGGALRAGLVAGAIGLAILFAGESVAGWLRFAQGERPADLDHDDLED